MTKFFKKFKFHFLFKNRINSNILNILANIFCKIFSIVSYFYFWHFWKPDETINFISKTFFNSKIANILLSNIPYENFYILFILFLKNLKKLKFNFLWFKNRKNSKKFSSLLKNFLNEFRFFYFYFWIIQILFQKKFPNIF